MYKLPQSYPIAEDHSLFFFFLQNTEMLELRMLNFGGPCLCFASFTAQEMTRNMGFGV